MFDQLRTLLWLKLVLFRHTWTTGRKISMILSIFVYMLMGMAALGAGVGLFFAGRAIGPESTQFIYMVGGDISPLVMMLSGGLIALFLMFWLIGLFTELQRSDLVDFRKMLFLPVSLRMVMLLNFCASLISPILPAFIFPTAGLILGLATGLGAHMLWGLVLATAFYFMLAAWTYYIRGILAFLMENKKRRRTILVLLPLTFVLMAQTPNIIMTYAQKSFKGDYSQSDVVRAWADHHPEASASWKKADTTHKMGSLSLYARGAVALFPPGWAALGIGGLAAGNASQALMCAFGMFALAGLGLYLGYASTLRFYMGGPSTGTAVRPPIIAVRATAAPVRPRGMLLDWRIPGLDDDTAAMALTSLTSYLRHPAIRLQLLMPLIIGVVLVVVYAGKSNPASAVWINAVGPVALVFWPFFCCIQFYTNQFGFDHEGFPALMLLPTPRRKILLGRNWGLFPIVVMVAVPILAVGSFFLKCGPGAIFGALLQIIQLHALFCLVGNLLSVYFPFRVQMGLSRGSRSMSTKSQLSLLAAMPFVLLTLILVSAPSAVGMMTDFILDKWYGYQGVPVGFILMLASLIVSLLLYFASLGPMGRLLMAREPLILARFRWDKE